MTRAVGRKWPLEPLLVASGTSRASLRQIAETFHVKHARQVSRWKAEGLTTRTAEDACDAVRLVPVEVWPDWYDDAIEVIHGTCDECGSRYMRYKSTHRFCSDKCRYRWRKKTDPERFAEDVRRRYWENPEHRQRHLERSKLYKREMRAAQRARLKQRALAGGRNDWKAIEATLKQRLEAL